MAASKVILLVDDEAILLLALKQSLRLHFGASYRYEIASDGAAGLDRVKKLAAEGDEPVLIISDWLMPRMRGDAFLTLVHESYPSIKLIMLTGHADESEMDGLARAVGLAAFIRKPWNTERLLTDVEKALSADPAAIEGSGA